MSSKKRSFWCRIGLHHWYWDSALIRAVERCTRCGRPESAEQAELVDAERRRMSALPGSPSLGDLYLAALDMTPYGKRETR